MSFRKSYLKYENDDKDRHLTAKIHGEAVKVGGALSSRQFMNVTDSAGREKKGFFTADSYVNQKAIFTEQLGKAGTDWNEFRPLLHAFTGSTLSYDEMDRLLKSNINVPLNRIPRLLKSSKGLAKASAERERDRILNLLSDRFGLDRDYCRECAEQKEFWDALNGIAKASNSVSRLYGLHTGYHGQGAETNINLRNNAMSDYAALLGIPDSVARSVSMTLIRDDMTTQGSFMENAQGESYDSFMSSSDYEDKRFVITGTAMKEMSNLQVLDYLCANIDRHKRNMFYKFDNSDPDEIRLIGVQGIDNDASFGTIEHKGKGLYDRMSKLEDIRVIDDDLARKILAADDSSIEQKIRLAGLSEEEMRAARERLTSLRERIKDGKVKRISGNEAWQNLTSPEEITKLGSTERRIFESGRVRDTENIFLGILLTKEDFSSLHIPQQLPSGDAPTAELLPESSRYALWNQIDRFRHLQSDLNGSLPNIQDPELEKVRTQLDLTVDMLSRYSGKDSLNAEEKESVLDEISLLRNTAAAFAAMPEKQDASAMNAVKNILAFAEDSARRLDPQEKSAFSHPALHTSHSYQSLHERISDVTSAFRGASDEFADLRKAIEAARLAETDPEMSHEQKRMLYDRVADAADLYLSYKIPGGSTDGLSGFAKKRVQFAKDALEYAEAKLDPLVREAEIASAVKSAVPGSVVTVGSGDLMEYDAVNGVYIRFAAAESNEALAAAKAEFLERMRIRNGGEEPDEAMLAYAEEIASLPDGAGQLSAMNREAQESAAMTFAEKTAEGPNIPSEAEAASPTELETIAEAEPEYESEAENETPEAMMETQRKIALRILMNPNSPEEEVAAAVTALMVSRKYGAGSEAAQLSAGKGENAAELTAGQKAAVADREKLLSDMRSGTEAYAAKMDEAKKQFFSLLPVKPYDKAAYLRELRSRITEEARQSGGEPTAETEKALFRELDAAAEIRKIPDIRNDQEFLKGLKTIEARHAQAYKKLSGGPSPEAGDDALLEITVCHSLSRYSQPMTNLRKVIKNGSSDVLSIDSCKKLQFFIASVKEIGRDEAKFDELVSNSRKQFAPYFAMPQNSLARDRMKDPIDFCRIAAGKASASELYKRESRMTNALAQLSSELDQPRYADRICRYLASAEAAKKTLPAKGAADSSKKNNPESGSFAKLP